MMPLFKRNFSCKCVFADINTLEHFHNFFLKRGAQYVENRCLMFERVIDFYSKSIDNVLIFGDFNMETTHPVMTDWKSQFIEHDQNSNLF